jgi:antibiotic biosynthesis monooxygenase (ABM) superfamily enzyme
MSADVTTTRRRGGGGGEGTSNDASSVLDLNRWTLQDEGEIQPLASSANDDGGDEEVGNQEDAPLTVKLTDFIEAQQEEEYLTWQRGIGLAMERSVGTPDVASILLREALSDGHLRFVVLFRFRNRRAAAMWHSCEERLLWLGKLKESSFHKSQESKSSSSSSSSSSSPIPMFDVTQNEMEPFSSKPRPQYWRTAFLVWIQVFLLVEFYGLVLPLVFGRTWYSISFHLQLVAGTALTTLTIERVTMQLVIKFARMIRFLASP